MKKRESSELNAPQEFVPERFRKSAPPPPPSPLCEQKRQAFLDAADKYGIFAEQTFRAASDWQYALLLDSAPAQPKS